jgi:hypothetical protein
MKIRTKLLMAALGLIMSALSSYADDVSFKVGKLSTTHKAGEAVVAEGGTYIIVPVTMKNLTAKEQSVGGMWHSSFKLKQGEFNFDVDGGVGWSFGNEGYFNGLAVLKPLMPTTLKVVFTVPTELINGKFTLVMPDNTEMAIN